MSRLVLVLGCHRSGTSLIAQSLECLGVEFGQRAHWSGTDNEVSFMEDIDVLAIDEELLRLGGGRWHSPLAELPDVLRDPAMIEMRRIAVHALSRKLAVHPVLGIKEPRMCCLLPFWRPVFALVGCAVSVVHAVRHPAAVAASLARRNGIVEDIGLALWVEHVRRARADADPAWPAVTVAYERMMTAPEAELARIGAALGLVARPERLSAFAAGGVRGDLWHQRADGALPEVVARVWKEVAG